MKILCTGDIHMGRRPSRLPQGVDTALLSSTRCWSAVVNTAIAEEVHVVALSGDVVDQANRYYEAVGPFEEGLNRLEAEGIRVVAVAGNHDHETLASIAENFRPESFTLLGRGGVWQRETIQGENGPLLHVDGWSFPHSYYTDDPLRGYAPPPDDGVPVLGLLHADLDASTSRYAPVRLADLRLHRVALWLLGHIHLPAQHDGMAGGTVLYPGSPQAMDPGEQGWHGVWIAELNAARRFDLRRVPLSTVRYDTLDVDVSAADSLSAVDTTITAAIREQLSARVEEGCGPLLHLSLRLRLTGRTPIHGELVDHMDGRAQDLGLPLGDVKAHIERVEVATRPALDLEELARGSDAPAIVARLALALQSGTLDVAHEELLQRATRAAAEVHAARPYRPIQDDPPPEHARGILHEHSLLLLDSLMRQKEPAR